MYDFDEDDPQYSQETDGADSVLEELEEQGEDEEAYGQEVMDKAMQRIEEANLFKLLINTSIFAKNSARPEILESVNNKIRQFAINELQMLLGMRQEEKTAQQATAPAQFSDEELHILKMLIGKVLTKSPGAAAPATTPVKPEINPIQIKEAAAPALNRPAAPKSAELAKPSKQKTEKAQATQKRKTVSKGFSRPNKGTKRLPMPTADQLIQNGLLGQPGIQVSAEAGVSAQNQKRGAVTVGNLINQIAGGHQVHVDNSNPADAALGGDSGGDTNERF